MNFLIGFEISYNNLNLPTVIYTEGDMGLYYTYLSDGTKIKVCGYDDNEPTRYAGSLVYNDGTFERPRSVAVGSSVRTTAQTRRCTIS